MKYLWTWGGTFFGYETGGLLFTHRGKCVGRFNGKDVYGKRGEYLGELMDEERLISDRSKRSWRGSAAPNVQGGAIARFTNYVGYVMYVGYKDFPSPDAL